MKTSNCVNILVGNVGLCNRLSAHYLKEMASKCDIICVNHNFEESDLNSILRIGNSKNFRKYEEFHKTGPTLFTPFFNKIIRFFKIDLNNMFLWYSYLRGNVYLENRSKIRFEVSDNYNLKKQSIIFWEFDVKGSFSNFKRLILANVNFTYFYSINKQISCIKSLRYSIKEIIWKNFISELIFNPQIEFDKIENNLITINFHNIISFMICGQFSNSNLSKDFLTLLGHGELISLDNNCSQFYNSNFNNYLLKSLTFSREDFLYFISVFPVSKVVGPDFNNYFIPDTFLNIFDLHHLNSNSLSNINNTHSSKSSSLKFTKFIFYDDVNVTKTSTDLRNDTHLQIISF
ncbi:uncharacterized protein cubi_01975 [Cryptosporidium ubiquitum]|uniref:Uncharacterized protein n=1 Tax=Cryptosporidium ubiquitum TaxID=857276 RepID=A0A1J4MMN3_9CRYT|nr:uncharacterized protein cubi_01975 [Cryptosporidium ubiquitum]OII75454.1 hypothetical protein cubi_01975 [Cryptosporidium ubiquitum]